MQNSSLEKPRANMGASALKPLRISALQTPLKPQSLQKWSTTPCQELTHPLGRKTLQRPLCHSKHMPPSVVTPPCPLDAKIIIIKSSIICGDILGLTQEEKDYTPKEL